jgi:hypothetical protein
MNETITLAEAWHRYRYVLELQEHVEDPVAAVEAVAALQRWLPLK